MPTTGKTRSRDPRELRRNSEGPGASTSATWLSHLTVVLVALLAVVRPLTPSEDAAQGTGLVFVQLWLFAALCWTALLAMAGQWRWRFHPLDLPLAVLLGAVIASSFFAASPRPAVNLTWEWAAILLAYVLTRQVLSTRSQNQTLAAAMLALAMSLALYGFYQWKWELPAMRDQYLRNPAAVLRQIGIQPGTPEADRYAWRLQSQEPLAMFALTNSLGGFLAAWLPVGLAWAVASLGRRRWASAILLLVALLPVAACLILTKSRSAYLGTLAGAGWLALSLGKRQLWRLRWWIAGCLMTFLALVAVGFAAGGLDRELLTETFKSLSYRWQYWQGAWGVITESPWHGVGPGNFGQHYLKYKLPQSSEDIADPHNFLLELWATSGLLAALAIVAGLFLFFLTAVRRCSSLSLSADEPPDNAPGTGELRPPRGASRRSTGPSLPPGSLPVLVGGFAAFPLALLVGRGDTEVYVGLLAAWTLMIGLLTQLLAKVPLAPAGLAAGTLALTVNLLAAGGIAYPAVGQSLWLLMALALNLSEGDGRELVSPRRWIAGAALAVATGALALCLWTVFFPVTTALGRMEEAAALLPAGRERLLLEATGIDPLSPEPWKALTQHYEETWHLQGAPAASADFDKACDAALRAIRLDPFRPSLHRRLADLYSEYAQRYQSAPHARAAAQELQIAAQRHPTSAATWASLSTACGLAGDSDGACRAAREALRLDAQTPHIDLKLSEPSRRELQGLVERSCGPP